MLRSCGRQGEVHIGRVDPPRDGQHILFLRGEPSMLVYPFGGPKLRYVEEVSTEVLRSQKSNGEFKSTNSTGSKEV